MDDFRLLWAFSPRSGRVHLYNEADHHPAEVPTHDSIARDLGEVGLSHGFAYGIPGGFRVLDYNHGPVEDPFVRRHVVDALRKRHQTQFRVAAAPFEWEEGNAPAYHAGLAESDRRRPGFVTVHEPEFYVPPHRVLTSTDGHTGYSLLDHGDGRIEMAGVFNNGPRGRGVPTVQHALTNGANYIECFESDKAPFSLPHFYHQWTGALPIGYYPWDDQYAHPQWDYARYGRPGLLEMTIPPHATPNNEEFEQRLAEIRGRTANVVFSDGLTGEDYTRMYDDWEEQTNREYEARMRPTAREYPLGDGGSDPNPTRSRTFIGE